MKLRSTDEFSKDCLALTVGAALAAIPCHLVAHLLRSSPAAAAVACGIAGTMTMFLALKSRKPALRLLPGATAAVLSGTALGALFPTWPVLGCLAFGAFFGLSQASAYRQWSQKLSLMATTAAAALVGGVVFGQLPHLGFLASALPQPVLVTGMFGLFGFYMGLGSLPGHVKVRRDLVGERYRELTPGLRPEIKDYMYRTYALYTRFQSAIPAGALGDEETEDHFQDDLERLTLKIFGLSATWQEIENHITGFRMGDLESRLTQIDDRIRQATDTEALAQYERSKAVLVQRTTLFQDVARSKERVVSQLTYCFTRMEELYFSLVRVRVNQVQTVATDIDGLLKNVVQLTEEMDATTKSLDELTRGVEPLPSLPAA